MMRAAPFRIFAEGPLADATTRLVPPSDERHHLKVRRAEPGQSIEVLDGQGRIGFGRLGADGTVAIERTELVPRPTALALLVGAADRDRFFWLVEKCVEIGVTELVPIETERSRQVATRIRDEHRDKLDRRAREALKQCGGAWSLTIHPVTPWADALAAVRADQRWLADPRGTPPDLRSSSASVAVAVGPEGGFTEPEIEHAQAAGFVLTRLGLRTLRFETAALAAAMIVRLEGEAKHRNG